MGSRIGGSRICRGFSGPATCAAKEGPVAAPTAGLHFTEPLLSALGVAGIDHLTVTLHVGAGTFLPVKVEEVGDHVMHGETGFLDAAAAERLNRVRAEGG